MHAVRRSPGGRIDVVGIASASVGRIHAHEPLGRYNLIRLDPARRQTPIEIVSRGLDVPGGPVIEVGRRVLADGTQSADNPSHAAGD